MELKKEKDQIIFIYNPYHGDIYWVQKEFDVDEEEVVNLAGTFYFKKDDIFKIKKKSIEFKLAKLKEDYFKIDGRVLGVEFNVFLYKEIDIDFKTISCAKRKNIFQFISEFRKVNEDIYIGGNNSTLDYEELENLVNQFPSSYEKELYNKARISQVLENYFDNIENYTYKLNNYREKKGYTKHSNHISYTEYDILKYENILHKLNIMLNDEEKYTEKQWGEELAKIILIMFPKYINFHEQVIINMTSEASRKRKEKVDFMLVKSDGCIDILEIKKSSNIFLVSGSCDHDNHYATSSLSKVTMQIEKYIYNITRDTVNFEKKINNKYKKYYSDNFELKVINPKGLIIMGRLNRLSDKQIRDLEIIRRMYANILDIYTYDDIIEMLENTIFQIKIKLK